MRTTLAACTVGLVAGAALAGEAPQTVRGWAAFGPDTWLVSDWDAGQSARVRWHPGNVGRDGDAVTLTLDRAEDGADRPLRGAEIQSGLVAQGGTWSWRARAPRMASGAIFGMFLYSADHDRDPWREYDIEFVGPDTTQVQLNIHFETDAGRHVSLGQARGGPVIVDLGFDAAKGFHDYAITVTDRSAVFRIDGDVVGRFGPADMPDGIWRPGLLRGFVDLWAVAPPQEDWAGRWRWPGHPLVAQVQAVGLPDRSGKR